MSLIQSYRLRRPPLQRNPANDTPRKVQTHLTTHNRCNVVADGCSSYWTAGQRIDPTRCSSGEWHQLTRIVIQCRRWTTPTGTRESRTAIIHKSSACVSWVLILTRGMTSNAVLPCVLSVN